MCNPKLFGATLFLLMSLSCVGQVTLLEADGPGGTYSLITSVLAPGNNPIEAPDCSHESFGDHIDEIYDSTLGKDVFRFHIHTTPDDDRCINFDRQRNEIKTYNPSPENLKGSLGEEVKYEWMFKLPAGFQASSSFTHIHQLKSVGGNYASHPLYTLTPRKASPDRLELRYGELESSVIMSQADIAPFIDEWVSVSEEILYDEEGTYSIVITRVSDGMILLEHSETSIDNWRPGADFVRPKWGIYRSLNNSQDLRDEEVLFADFLIQEYITEIPYNGIDDDDDPLTLDDDLDQDGYLLVDDCNDDNAEINPGMVELCDDIDNNCNGLSDEVCTGMLVCEDDDIMVFADNEVYTIASTSITSVAHLDDQDSTIYYAGDHITLNSGFTVGIGKAFTAVIEDCSSDIIPDILEAGFEDNSLPDGTGDGRDSWRNDVGGVVQITTNPVHEGLQSGKLPFGGDRVAMQEIAVTPGSDYELTFHYTMASSPGTLTVSVLDEFITSASQLADATIATVDLTDNSSPNTYVEVTLSFNSGDHSAVTIYLGNTGSDCRFDSFTIE